MLHIYKNKNVKLNAQMDIGTKLKMKFFKECEKCSADFNNLCKICSNTG